MSEATNAATVLLVTAGLRTCAVPVDHVLETMRPLPVDAIAGLPAAVRGVALIRGTPVPVVDLARLLGDARDHAHGRFVTLKLGERSAALAVSTVSGVQRLDLQRMQQLPPLLRDTESELIEAIGISDAQLMLVLRAARIVPDGAWDGIAMGAGAR